MLTLLIALTFCGTMLYAAVSDLLFMRISNIACLFLATSFILFAPLVEIPFQTILLHLSVGLVALAICFGLFMLNAMGGGDAKLIGATVVWTGFSPSLVQYLLISAIAGGILTLCVLLMRKLINREKIKNIDFLYRLTDPAKGIPYGIALAIAGFWIYPLLPIAG